MVSTCPKCSRQFKTKGSLQQHVASAGCAPKSGPRGAGSGRKRSKTAGNPVPAPVQVGYRTGNRDNRGTPTVLPPGSDFMGPLVVKAKREKVEDAILATFPISPSAYPGTRLTQMSQLWEYYRFRRLAVRYVPAVPTTVGCQLVAYIDTDPTDNPLQAKTIVEAVRRAVAHASSREFNIYAAQSIPLVQRADDTLYYCGSRPTEIERFVRQGKLHIVQITDPVNINTEPLSKDLRCGSLFLDWHIEFQVEQLGRINSTPEPPVPPQPPQPDRAVVSYWPRSIGNGSKIDSRTEIRFPGAVADVLWDLDVSDVVKLPIEDFSGTALIGFTFTNKEIMTEDALFDIFYTGRGVDIDVGDNAYWLVAHYSKEGVSSVYYNVVNGTETDTLPMPSFVVLDSLQLQNNDTAGLVIKKKSGTAEKLGKIHVSYWRIAFSNVEGLHGLAPEFVGELPTDRRVDSSDDFVVLPSPEGAFGVRRWAFSDGSSAVGMDSPPDGGPATFSLCVGGEYHNIMVPPSKMQDLVDLLGDNPALDDLDQYIGRWPDSNKFGELANRNRRVFESF